MLKKAKTKKMPFKIDGITLNRSIVEKILLQEKTKKISLIDDLSELNTKSESELFEVISQMMQNKTFFKYCYSLLININPGPEYVYDYLNLKDWITNENISINNNDINIKSKDNKPHLYTFMSYVYETMKKENKDQVISILGPLGSGKTFNIIHIMEYFATLYSYPNYNFDNFEIIHKSIQFIHILGSIFRENNLESSSCGLLLNLGFNNNNLICSFDIEAQILDYTLPFNEKGRTFSIFHALISGANEDLRRKCKLTVIDDNLFNIKKSKKNMFYRNEKEKEKFKLNDLEIWNRFYSLLKYFHFTKNEMLDIINSFSFILNINELIITKVKGGKLKNIDYYEIQRGITTKKICKNLGLVTDDKIDEFENILKDIKFKTLQEMEIFLQSLMKQTYYIIFEYVLQKIKTFINEYFSKINKIYKNNIDKSKNKNDNIKYIYFIDFPGEVGDRSLGGFTTNVAHECLNLYSATAYYEIVEKILLENILLKKFKPLKSYAIINNCFNKGSILDNFSKPLNDDTFLDMKQNILENLNIYNCYRFPESKKSNELNYNFYCSFSDKNVIYNYEYLYYESKSLLFNPKIYNIFSFAKNVVISSIYKNNQTKLQSLNNFYNFYISSLKRLFNPIKNYKPFVVYCLHSNDSYKYFFPKKEEKNMKTINENNSEISLDIIKHSIIPAILNWNWHGFKEWIKIDDFLSEYGNDFEKVKNRIILINNNDQNNPSEENNLDFANLSKKEKAKCMLNILARDFDYILGNEYIIMKKGTLKRIAIYLNSMIDTAEELSKNLIFKIKTTHTNSSKNNGKKKLNYELTDKNKSKSKIKDDNSNNNSSNISKKNTFNFEPNLEKIPLPQKKDIKYLEENIYKENPDERRNLIKDQCSIDIISYKKNNLKLLNNDEKNLALKSKYLNINYILDKFKNKRKNDKGGENAKLDELINYKDEKMKKNIPSKNNTVVSDPVFFNKVKSLFDPTKSRNIKLFDYSENVDSITKIQSIFRSLEAQKKYKILKYISRYIILVQKLIRGLLCRKKVKYYMKCSKSVLIIQKFYKKHYKKLNESAKKIQDFYKKKKESLKERDKLILKMKLEAEKEKCAYINVDKIMDNILKNSDEDIHNIVKNLGKNKNTEYNDNNDNIDNIDNKNNKNIKNNKSNKNKLNKNNYRNKIDATKDLMNETNKRRVIDLLLYSSMPDDEKIYRKKKKRAKSDYYRIEDKLIYEGEQIKKNREKKMKESQEKVDPNLYFNPIISKKNYEITKKYPNDFLKRVEYYKLFKKRNIENLRNKYYLNKINDMRFEPTINNDRYNKIHSKFFDYYNYQKPNKENKKNNLDKNENKKENDVSYPEKEKEIIYNTNLNNKNNYDYNGHKIKINEDDINNYDLMMNYKSEEIWPKNLYHKYLESKNIESSKTNN